MVRSVSLQLGAVKVSHGTSSAIYGFTAGHAFQTHFGGRREADENRIQREGHEVDVEITIDSDDENNDDDLVILDFESTGYNDAREIRTSQKDIGIEGKNTSEESEESAEPRIAIHYMNKPVASSPWAYTDCELYASSVPDGLGLDSDRDWALLKMPPGVAVGLNLPTIIATLSISQSHAKFLPDLCGGRPGRPVKILVTPKYASDQDGLRGFSVPALATCNPEHCGEGFLRAGLSLVMLSSGNDFVQTYNLRFSNGGKCTRIPLLIASGLMVSELLPGQCGAWVVDAETDALYGHIIASDSLGETYVVPIQSTFRDIERSLNATSVSLPSVPGLQYEAHYRMISNIGPSDYAGLSDRKSISTHGTSTLEATNLPYLSTSEETTLPVTLEHSELSNIKVSSGSASASDLKDNNTGASPSGDEQLTIDSLAPKESLLTRALAFGSRCLAASLPMPVSRASTVPRESSQFEAHIPSYSPYHATDIVQPGYPLVHTMEHGRPDPWADLLDEQTKARHGGDISYQLTRAMKQLNTHLASPSRSPSIGQNESWYSESIGHQNLLLRAREQLKADSTALGRSPNTSDTSQYVPSFFGSPLPQNSPHAGYNSTSRSSSSKPSLRGVDDSMTLSPTAKPRIRPVIHRGDGNSYSSQSSRMDLARDKRFP